MLRLLIIVAAVCLVCRSVSGKWPWEFLRGTPVRTQALNRARTLLGVAPGAGRDEVIAAHRRLTALVHPDRGGTTAAMQEANAARDLLLGDLPASGDESPPQSRD